MATNPGCPVAARDKKVLIGIAVEVGQGRGLGRCRMAPLSDASSASLHAFIAEHVELGATVITDAWQGYRGLEAAGYVHERRSQRAARAAGEDPHDLLPAVHRVASLLKRWLLGTHQGAVEPSHPPVYLDEFVFRFNCRRSHSRGAAVLPGPRARRGRQTAALCGPDRRPTPPRPAAEGCRGLRPPRQPRSSPRQPPLADR